MTRSRRAVEATAEMSLSDDPDEVNHLVCCRDSWAVALCGFREEPVRVNLTSTFFCAMCVETITRARPNAFDEDPRICPLDHAPCPPEGEIDARIERAIDRPLD